MKVDLRGAELVQSHTPETAAQEIAAFPLGYAMLVEQRMRAAAAGEVPVLRISFRQTLAVVRALWTTLALTGDLLSQAEKHLVVQRALDQIAAQVSAPRRSRSCPRAVGYHKSTRAFIAIPPGPSGPAKTPVPQTSRIPGPPGGGLQSLSASVTIASRRRAWADPGDGGRFRRLDPITGVPLSLADPRSYVGGYAQGLHTRRRLR